jgi:hypothetical protein
MSVSLWESLGNKISYEVQQYVVDPQADEYAAKKKAAEDAAASAERKRKEIEASAAAAPKPATAEEQMAAEKARQEAAAKNEFSGKRLVKTIFGTIVSVLFTIAIFAGAIYGACLAVNLNIYRTWPYRLLYAIYGFIFFPLVIIYVLGYRWWWLERKPIIYSTLPLIPYRMTVPWMEMTLGWLTYRPDDIVETLQEWNPEMVQAGKDYMTQVRIEESLIAE